MKPLLRPGTSVVRRSARALQIGTVTGAALVVADRPGVSAVLRGADGTRDLDTIAATSQQPRAVVAQAAASLLEAGALLDARTWDDVGGAVLVGEARALAASGEPRERVTDRLRARSTAPVEIVGDRQTEDLVRRLGQILGEAGADTTGTIGPQDAPDLVVVVSAGPSPREAFDVLTGEGVPHLPVVSEFDRVRVGPLVRPGLTPCVRCDDVDRAGYEPTWPSSNSSPARSPRRPRPTRTRSTRSPGTGSPCTWRAWSWPSATGGRQPPRARSRSSDRAPRSEQSPPSRCSPTVRARSSPRATASILGCVWRGVSE